MNQKGIWTDKVDPSEVRNAVLDLFADEYPLARRALSEFEAFTGKGHKDSQELLMAFDRLHEALEHTNLHSAQSCLQQARTHLRKSIVEPMEYLAKAQFVAADSRYRSAVFKLPFPSNPITHGGVYGKLRRAQQLILDGGTERSNKIAYQNFKESFEITADLLEELTAVRWGIGIAAWLLILAGAAATVLRYFW